jgi:hypothetical protein
LTVFAANTVYLAMHFRLEKVMSKTPKHFSALWSPKGMEGMLLVKQASVVQRSKTQVGWRWLILEDELPREIQRLRGQVFETRRDAVQALKIALTF